MKNLKFIFVFLIFAGLASCSSDDEGNSDGPDETDRIIGEWQIQQILVDGEEFPLTDCELQSTLEFMANGNVTTTDFYVDSDTEECDSEAYTEQWENRGNNIYRISGDGLTYDVTIIFSNNNNTFMVTEEDGEGSSSVTYDRI